MAMATFQQDLTALRIKTDRIEGELRNMITRDNLQDVISEAHRRFVDDGMWKDLAVAEMAKIRNEVEDVTRRAQAEFHQHGAVLQAADMGYQQTRGRQDAMEGMLTELRKAVEMVANSVAELRSADGDDHEQDEQDAGLGEGPGADKADRRGPACETDGILRRPGPSTPSTPRRVF